jgi:hypothetical protein
MRKLLFFLLVLVVGTIGLGFYLDWFRISTSREAETGKRAIEVNIDTKKIKTDTETAKEKIGVPSAKAESPSEQK